MPPWHRLELFEIAVDERAFGAFELNFRGPGAALARQHRSYQQSDQNRYQGL